MTENHQPSQFNQQGFSVFDALFTAQEIAEINREIEQIVAEQQPGMVYEDDGKTLRSINGSHQYNAKMAALTKDPRLLRIAQNLLGDELYIHQFKINFKSAFCGDIWEWHQDYYFWQQEDGMPGDQAISIAIFLDDVSEFNSPLTFIPGTHNKGTFAFDKRLEAQNNVANWEQTTATKLKYQYDETVIKNLVKTNGLNAPKGKAGTGLVFHSNILHASSANISPYRRGLLIISYNALSNKLNPVENPRPTFLASRDFSPVT